MTPDRVAASIASFDFLYLTELRAAAASSRRRCARAIRACTPPSRAATCWSRSTGLHRNVWVFDFKSLYPSIIRTFNIDPLSYVAEPAPGEDLIADAGRRVPARTGDPAAHAR